MAETTFYEEPKSDPLDRVQLEFGDSKQVDFYPQLKIMRWDNEVNLSVRLIQPDASQVVSKSTDIVSWVGGDIDCKWYPTEDGHEFDVILKKKPLTNKINFSLVTKGLKFVYQPPLRDEVKIGARDGLIASVTDTDAFDKDGRSVYHRPENVVGSYAVRMFEPKWNIEGGKIYRSGKVGHIYRPKMIDSKGVSVWGVLSIDEKAGVLSVEIPQKFLDEATYPIHNAAGLDFGYTTLGASQENGWSGYALNWNATSPATAGMTASAFYVGCYSSGTQYVKPAMFTDGSPETLLANSAPGALTAPASKNWVNGAITASIAASTKYWFTACPSNDSVYVAQDAGDVGGYVTATYSTYPAATYNLTDNYTADRSLYVTYTAGGEPSSYTASGSLTQSGVATRRLSLNRTQSGVL